MLIIERILDKIAIIESDDGNFEINKNALPQDAREGDVIIKTNDSYIIDTDETAKRRALVEHLYNKIKPKP